MLEVESITKQYSSGCGVSDISFSVKEGTVVAVVGPNGAGKSTLFNVIAGIQKPDSGSCLFNSVEINCLPASSFGFLPESDYLIPNFTPYQMLMYVNQMRELKLSDKDIKNWIEKYDITAYMNKRNRSLSQGMKKRVSLVCTLMGNPRFVILDEPTNGLDTQGTILLKESILKAADEKTIVLISSHILDFIGKISDDILFIKKGKIISKVQNEAIELDTIYKNIFMK